MDIKSVEYHKYFRIGEIATLKIEEDSGVYQEFNCIIAQVSEVSCELGIMYDELSEDIIGREQPAVIMAMVGYLHCECPVIIGKNSFEQMVFARFSGEATILIKRNYIRQDVLIPFIYTQVRGFETAKELVQERRSNPRLVNFTDETHGESFKVVSWQGNEDVLPVRINLGGGGLRFTTIDPFPRNSYLVLQIFLNWPKPKVVHAVLKVIRSKPFEQTPEDRFFYNWAKLRLKSQTISITAGSYEFIEDEDREAIIDYIKEMQSLHKVIADEGSENS
jgi:hypothetical protein